MTRGDSQRHGLCSRTAIEKTWRELVVFPQAESDPYASVAFLPLRPSHSVLQRNFTRLDVAGCEVRGRKVVHRRIDLDDGQVDSVLMERTRGETCPEPATSASQSVLLPTCRAGADDAHNETLLGLRVRQLRRSNDESYKLLEEEGRVDTLGIPNEFDFSDHFWCRAAVPSLRLARADPEAAEQRVIRSEVPHGQIATRVRHRILAHGDPPRHASPTGKDSGCGRDQGRCRAMTRELRDGVRKCREREKRDYATRDRYAGEIPSRDPVESRTRYFAGLEDRTQEGKPA